MQIIILFLFACLYLLIITKKNRLSQYISPIMIIFVTILTVIALRNKDNNFLKINNVNKVNLFYAENLKENHPISPKYVVTDDINLYNIIYDKVIVNDVNTLDIKKELTFPPSFQPFYLFVSNNKLIVLGEINNSTTEVLIFNLHDYSLFKQIKIEAKYIKSKIINEELYLVTSKMINNSKQKQTFIINNQEKSIENIYYINNIYQNNFINILKINLTNKDEIKVISYLGLGFTIYFADNNLYIAEEVFNKIDNNNNKSIILKIDLKKLTLKRSQTLKGFVLNENALNEYHNQLRIVSSEQYDDVFTNHLYILNSNLKIEGVLQNFSTGKQLQAVVFNQDKAYIETFKNSNQTYIINLSNKTPKIINEVILSGYDTYLFPFNHYIIGFGILQDKSGIRVSLYQKDDFKLFKQETIMLCEAFTEAMYNNQQLLVDNDNKLIGFPVLFRINSNNYKQIYYVFKVNEDLKQLGTVSHYPNSKDTNNNYDIKVGLVINNKLYTVSNQKIMINNLSDLQSRKEKLFE